MNVIICFAALGLLIFLAYRGHSVILAAPVAALFAVVLTSPSAVPAAFSGLYMEKLATFVRLYLPVFVLGALFGKLIEVSGAARSIVSAITAWFGARHAILSVSVVGMLLTYGGVSVFVVVFAVYPFAAEMFRQADIPKRLLPATIAFSAFTITMDALPGTPQIQNIIPTAFFGTTAYAAPVLGVLTSMFVFGLCFAYLRWRQAAAAARGEGYGSGHSNEPDPETSASAIPVWLAMFPLLCVGIGNIVILRILNSAFSEQVTADLNPGTGTAPIVQSLKANAAIWAVEGALLLGIVLAIVIGWKTIRRNFTETSKAAVSGSLLASLNTASEYGFGGVIAALPGFSQIVGGLSGISNPLLNAAVLVNVLCAVTGSASGGLSLALGALGERFSAAATADGIPLEVMHRIASLASGGMDTLPHNGAIITLLAVTGMTHRQVYKDIFAITVVKTLAAFFAITVFYSTGLV
ncbi:GntP family permease [Brucella intermedia]|uniref:GntP family permease n=1 Tax=Brucella intermedia TaxID=94625 RepID=UPI003209A2BB